MKQQTLGKNMYYKRWKQFITENDDNDSDRIGKVVIFNEKNEVLIMKRGHDAPKYPSYWNIPGGHVKNGEKIIDGAARETKEESGLDVRGLKMVKKEKNIHFFSAESYSGDINVDPAEHSEHKWEKIENLSNYDMPPDEKSAIKSAFEEKSTIDEDYQTDIRQKHPKLKKKNIGMGGNKKKTPPFEQNPSYKRGKSAPAGFGGA